MTALASNRVRLHFAANKAASLSQVRVKTSAEDRSIGSTTGCTITEKATTAFTFKTLVRHYAKRALTPGSLNVKLGSRRNYHEECLKPLRHYTNQPARPLCESGSSLLRDCTTLPINR